MQTISWIIEQLGGTTKVARALKTPITTVQSWKVSNKIPQWRKPPLIALCKRRGKQDVADALASDGGAKSAPRQAAQKDSEQTPNGVAV